MRPRRLSSLPVAHAPAIVESSTDPFFSEAGFRTFDYRPAMTAFRAARIIGVAATTVALLTAGPAIAQAADYGPLTSCADPGPVARTLQTSGTCADARAMIASLKSNGFKGAAKSGLRCFTKADDATFVMCVRFDKRSRASGSVGTAAIADLPSHLH